VWHYRFDNGGFEDEEHYQGEDAVVPVFVEAPQQHTKHLEHEERRHCLLSIQLTEGWNRYLEPVVCSIIRSTADRYKFSSSSETYLFFS